MTTPRRHADFRVPVAAAHPLQGTVKLLGLKKTPRTELELASLAAEGLPSSVLVTLSGKLGWTREQLLSRLHLVPRTLSRRLAKGQALTVGEGERVLRLARVLARAAALFDNDLDAAKEWLAEPSLPLGGKAPVDFLTTDVGTELVLNELGQIEYGFFA